MNRTATFFKQYRVFVSSVVSFTLGASFVAYLQPKMPESLGIDVIKRLGLNKRNTEVLNSALLDAKEDPLNINFELSHIERENKVEATAGTTDQILLDFQNRISPEFAVPELIFNQTKFWFRVYTEFDSNKKVIHDSLHPHIIYDVVDVGAILSLPAKAHWLNVVKAEKVVAKRVADIRVKLKKMVKMREEDMDAEQLGWLAQLKEIQGNQRRIITLASQSLRIQTGQKDFFERGLNISPRYLSGMETIFKNKKLPIELTRLPFVESSFATGATSKVGAAGIWQFMPGIGRKFLSINDQFDERRNPWKATEAAATLLKENYNILHKNWGLALTAYNHGPGGVKLAMKKIGSKDISKIVRSYRSRSFDFASANFFTCFLAAMHAQIYRDLIWKDRVEDSPLVYEQIRLKKSLRPAQLLEAVGFSPEQILVYNPELDRSFKRNGLIPKGYRLFIPVAVKTAEAKEQASN